MIKFIIACWKCISNWILNKKAAADLKLSMSDRFNPFLLLAAFNEEAESEYGLKMGDIDAICTLFQIIPIMWRGISGFLALAENEALVQVCGCHIERSCISSLLADRCSDLTHST